MKDRKRWKRERLPLNFYSVYWKRTERRKKKVKSERRRKKNERTNKRNTTENSKEKRKQEGKELSQGSFISQVFILREFYLRRMKSTLLIVLIFLVALSVAAPDRYLRKTQKPKVCNKGDTFRNSRCWKNCPSGYSAQWNNWFRCQKNCKAGENSNKGRCYTRRCVGGFHVAAGKCYANACPRGFVNLSKTECQRPCPKPYTAMGRKCVNKGAKPGQCDSYTRPKTKRASRPFIVYPQSNTPRRSYLPSCPKGWDMMPPGRTCYGPCKPQYLRKGKWCKNKVCFTNKKSYKRGGPVHPTVCPKTFILKNRRCWKKCSPGWSNQWNNWYRCQKNCKGSETFSKGTCYTKRCVGGFHVAAGKCYANACPRGFVNLSKTECQRPCPKPYTVMGRKCVNKGAKPGQCDSYTRPKTKRASRPFIIYRTPTKGKTNVYPSCPGGWKMEARKCRKICRPDSVVCNGGRDCCLKKCVGI